MNTSRLWFVFGVLFVAACGITPAVDTDAGPQPDLAGAEDLGQKADLASAARDLATVDTGTTPDLAPTADLAEARDLTNVDPNSTPDMADSSQFFIRLSSAIKTVTVATCGGKLVNVESIALEFENTHTHTMAVKQFRLTGVASINGGPLVANDLDKAIVTCQFVNDGNGMVVAVTAFVDQMGRVLFPNVTLTVPKGKTIVKALCDLNQIGPAGASFALGIASARDVVVIDTVNQNDVVATIDPNVIDNAGVNATAVVVNITTDFDAPSITLNGNNPDSMMLGGIYADPGATATDLVDGAIPVVVSGFVNGNKIGANTVTYTATDKCGNTATTTRTVNVVEPYCGIANVNGQMVKANALVSVDWSIITPSGPVVPGFQQTIGIVTITNSAGSMVCEDVDVNRVVLEFSSTFAVGTAYIYLDNPWGQPVVTFFPPMRGKFEATFLPRTFEISTGQTRRLYIVADTFMAMQADALSVRLGVPVEYVTRISGTSYQTNGQDGLPTIYKTFTY